MAKALVALGSNVEPRRMALEQAVDAIRAASGVKLLAQSRSYATAPVGGPSGQGEFLNSAALINTSLAPIALLALLQEIEDRLGRARQERWGARSIDLDLLLYDEQVISTPDLQVPHPRMAFRRFVLEPAAEIASSMRHATLDWTVGQIWDHLRMSANYVALAGPPGSLKKALAQRLCSRFDGRLVSDGRFVSDSSPVGGENSSIPGLPGKALAEEIELLAQRVKRLAACSVETDRRLKVSDFWLGESSVVAQERLDKADWERFSRRWAATTGEVMRPRLIVLLDAPAAWLRANVAGGEISGDKISGDGAESGRIPSIAEIEAIRSALSGRLAEGGHGPILWLDASDSEQVWVETTAAIEAMQ